MIRILIYNEFTETIKIKNKPLSAKYAMRTIMNYYSLKIKLLFLIMVVFFEVKAVPDYTVKEQGNTLRADCIQPISIAELNINNVRATLLNAGDLWWNLQNGGYVVPKDLNVSSIFVGGLWMGGFDPIGNLKVAAQTYRRSTRNDYWTGPLDSDGQIDALTCENWDRFFEIKGVEIHEHIAAFRANVEQGILYAVSDIPASILAWPAKGNPHFFEIHGFHLPEDRGIAAFYDYNDDGIYDPVHGDYPVLKRSAVNNGEDHFLIPDQMISWVFNDNGGIHTSSNGFPLQMEVQACAFAYKTNDEINDLTFQQFRFHSFAPDDIEQFHVALFVDPDLGCYADDYMGVDTTMDMIILYNENIIDSDIDCYQLPGYYENKPVFGIRFFDGLKSLDTLTGNISDKRLTSFIYFNNPSFGQSPPGMTDPSTAQEYYRYMTGRWRDGSRIVPYGNGYNPNFAGASVNYTFYSSPSDQCTYAWSLCTEDLSIADRRVVGGSGPITMEPGSINEIMTGNIFVPSQKYPCPSIKPLQYTAEMAEVFLFDQAINDGIIPEGPDPPDLIVEEWSDRITLRFSNEATSNNYMEQYTHPIPSAAAIRGEETELYRFEGYRVFQVVHDSVQAEDLNNPEMAMEVFQCDIANDISSLFNWKRNFDNPALPPVFYTELMVDGQNKGIESTFILKNDAFTGEKFRLNGTYHFVAMAYAWNNYADVDPETGIGQRKPYLQGNISRLTLFNDEIKTSSAKLYPSMLTSGNSNLWLENVPEYNKILLLNSHGNLLKSWQFLENNDRISITIPSDLSPGLYFVQIVRTGHRTESLRFIVL